MSRVDRQPDLRRVAARFGVPALALPVGGLHTLDELERRGARGTEGLERRRHLALVVPETRGPELLVVAGDHRLVLDQQLAQPLGRGGLAVGQMLNDLTGAPLPGDGMGREGVGGETFHGALHRADRLSMKRNRLLELYR